MRTRSGSDTEPHITAPHRNPPAVDERTPADHNRTPGTRPVDRLTWVAISGVGTFTSVVVALHVLEPEFDPERRFVSEYVLGDWGWLMKVAFFALGIGLVALGVATARTLAPIRRTRVVRNLYISCGVAAFVSGLFDSDELVDGEVVDPSAHGAVHDLAGIILFGSLIAATFLLRKAFAVTPGWENRAKAAPIVGSGLVAGLVATATPHDWFGLAQRAFLVGIVGWLAAQTYWLRTSE